jgi:hypothetical protein
MMPGPLPLCLVCVYCGSLTMSTPVLPREGVFQALFRFFPMPSLVWMPYFPAHAGSYTFVPSPSWMIYPPVQTGGATQVWWVLDFLL